MSTIRRVKKGKRRKQLKIFLLVQLVTALYLNTRLVPDVDANGQPKLDEYGKQIFIKEPIACNCIFPNNEYEKEIGPSGAYFRPRNRKERRAKRN